LHSEGNWHRKIGADGMKDSQKDPVRKDEVAAEKLVFFEE
jgi:hypothetical protein